MLPSVEDRARGRAPLALLFFLAFLTSLVALTIDAVLPALDAMDRDLGFADANARHDVVMAVFVGLAIAQTIVGPLADALGRRTIALAGLGLYLIGAIVAGLATSPEMLIAGRFVQGLGAGGPRVVSIAVARDLYEGRAMARVVSLVNTVFMLVPMLAPLAGQGIEALGGWRAIFAFYALFATVAALWYIAGMPETLSAEARRPLRLRSVLQGWGEVLRRRQAVLAAGITIAVFGTFTAYLATAQQILEEAYALGPLFPLAFSGLAAAFACASFLNSRLVMRFGMRRLSGIALWQLTGTGLVGAGIAMATGGLPPLWLFLVLLGGAFVAVAVVFANMIALGTEGLEGAAGTATSFLLGSSTLGASLIGSVIAAQYDGRVGFLFIGFAGLGALALILFAFLSPSRTAGAEDDRGMT